MNTVSMVLFKQSWTKLKTKFLLAPMGFFAPCLGKLDGVAPYPTLAQARERIL